ncbi:MAG: DUF4282 domain-containing protein [Clostridiales bacterium]|nr:DUF4282 domain-containing protein [Clostridiales bacterium]
MDRLSTLFYSESQNTWFLISGALALVGAVIVQFWFLRPQGRARYRGLMQIIHEHVSFSRFIIPDLLKFAYVASVLYVVFSGIVTLISGGLWTGILMIVLGPIAVRIAYELIMLIFSIHDGIKETNRLLRTGAISMKSSPQPHARPMHPPQAGDEQSDHPRHYPGGYDPIHKA